LQYRVVKIRPNSTDLKSLTILLAGMLVFNVGKTSAATLFNETFEGYTSFPTENPTGYFPPDMVNMGIPEFSEGASEFWFGARFGGSGSIDADLAIQQYGGGANETHVGRVSHDAGMVLRIDTTGYENVNLSFIWRTFQAESPDRFTVGYHVGDDLGFAPVGPNRFLTLTSGPGAWSSGWTQLLSGSAGSTWRSKSSVLPSDAGPIYVAFWMNNGHGDFGKFDNILITATPIEVPEPTAFALVALGAVSLVARKKSRQ
jgi:hypothetical protein